MLRGVVASVYADNDMEHYGDGRPVMGRLRSCDDSQLLHPWHPDPAQEFPREIRTVNTRYGTRKRVIVAAPSILDCGVQVSRLRVGELCGRLVSPYRLSAGSPDQ
jgi:hypothetical protein